MHVRALRRDADRDALAALWDEALAPVWPVLPDGLDTFPAGYVAEDGGRVVGVVGLDPAGSIPFVAVVPTHRRRGVGTALVHRALDDLAADATAPGNPATVGVGGGGTSYIWPGVPTDLTGARPFFTSLGWVEDRIASDLVQDLQAPGVVHRLRAFGPPAGVELALARGDEDEMDAVLGFEAAHFPHWLRSYRDRDPGQQVLIARDATGAIVGALLLAGPGRVTVLWPMLGEDAGTIGCVGVEPHRHGRGIGTTMVAHASRLLAERGTRWCHIAWVERLDFYGRVGYRVWRRYHMGRLPIGRTRSPVR